MLRICSQKKVSGIKKKQAPRAGPTEPTIETEGDADNEQTLHG
ncbi:unnamed protein product [Brassica rapa]|uniref:Uncharacterized protein n=1 Tax=Brassica campestris TaxID=3711 RepID=A0A3P5XVA1_BRACM|nr:unnamed protein product [Brassica rapa]VDC58616.1 unnamed protein product [Brassica rapa]